MASGSFKFGDVFGRESAFYQLFVWQVLAQVITAIGAPGLEALSQLVQSHAPVNPLSVAEAVDAALRGHMPEEQAAAEASLSGISRERFRVLLDSAGQPLGPAELAVALRRGLIPEQGAGAGSISFDQGVREGRLANKWTDVAKALATQWPTPTDALDALLEGQVAEDEGRALYERLGGDPQFFQMLFNTRGSAPTPVEAATMAQRGIIPWEGTGPDAVSFVQAGLEGPWRNKWIAAFRGLSEYLPPPRTVTAMIGNGSLSDDAGLKLLLKQGLTPELAAAYVTDAHHTKAQGTRALAKADILALYLAREIDRPTAAAMLGDLGFSDRDAEFELGYQDFKREKVIIDQAISRLRSLFLGHKTDEQTALNALSAVGVPADQSAQLLKTWKLEVAAEIKILTAAEVCDSVKYGLMDANEALARLEEMGYAPDDAWLRLGVVLHGPPTDFRPAAVQ